MGACVMQSGGRCCQKEEGRMFATKLEEYGGDIAKLQAWRNREKWSGYD